MLWTFVAVFVISTSLNSCVSAENLTAVVWENDVNTPDKLQKAFESSEVKAIEVDVVYGFYKAPPKPDTTTTTSTTSKPGESTTTTATTVKPHPGHKPEHRDGKWDGILLQDPKVSEDESPARVSEDSWIKRKPFKEVVIKQETFQSNLRFSDFLEKAIEFSKGHETKSVKLNFNDHESVEYSVDLIQRKHREIKFSIWLHANVLEGPFGFWANLNPKEFIEQYKLTSKYVLSLGWITRPMNGTKTGYTEEHTKKMKAVVTDIVEKNKIEEPLNVPLRALYVPQSTTILQNFFKEVKTIHPKFTYSIWSAKGDKIKVDEVQSFVKLIGIENVYLNLSPDE